MKTRTASSRRSTARRRSSRARVAAPVARERGQVIRKGHGKYGIRVPLLQEEGSTERAGTYNETFYGTEAEAHARRRHLNALVLKGEIAAKGETIEAFGRDWLNNRVGLAPKTIWNYNDWFTRLIVPHIGALGIKETKHADVQRWVKKLGEIGVGASSIRDARKLLHALFNHAKNTDIVKVVPTGGTELPEVESVEAKPLTEEEAVRVLTETRGHRYHPLWVVAVETGMRPQEFLALSWDAFDGANITVCRRLREVPKITEMTPEEQLAAGVRGRIKKPAAALPRWIIVPGAKSKAGKRQVVLFKHTVEVLNRHREQQLEQISRGEMKNPDNLIFPTRNGTFIDPSELRKQWKKMLADLGIPHRRMYDTRHTHITHMIDHGVPITVVQDRVGHEDPRMLKVYAKIQAGKQQKHVGALEAELPYTNDEAQVQTQPTGRKARMVIGYCECCAGISTLALVGTVALCVKCGSEYERADERAEFPPLRAVA